MKCTMYRSSLSLFTFPFDFSTLTIRWKSEEIAVFFSSFWKKIYFILHYLSLFEIRVKVSLHQTVLRIQGHISTTYRIDHVQVRSSLGGFKWSSSTFVYQLTLKVPVFIAFSCKMQKNNINLILFLPLNEQICACVCIYVLVLC